jgi:hypothetical protein
MPSADERVLEAETERLRLSIAYDVAAGGAFLRASWSFQPNRSTSDANGCRASSGACSVAFGVWF